MANNQWVVIVNTDPEEIDSRDVVEATEVFGPFESKKEAEDLASAVWEQLNEDAGDFEIIVVVKKLRSGVTSAEAIVKAVQ